MYMEPYIAPGT